MFVKRVIIAHLLATVYFCCPLASLILLVIIRVIKTIWNHVEDILIMAFLKSLIAQNWSQFLTLPPAELFPFIILPGVLQVQFPVGWQSLLPAMRILCNIAFVELFLPILLFICLIWSLLVRWQKSHSFFCHLPPNNVILMRVVHSVSRQLSSKEAEFCRFWHILQAVGLKKLYALEKQLWVSISPSDALLPFWLTELQTGNSSTHEVPKEVMMISDCGSLI